MLAALMGTVDCWQLTNSQLAKTTKDHVFTPMHQIWAIQVLLPGRYLNEISTNLLIEAIIRILRRFVFMNQTHIDMNTKIVVACASLSVLCCLYFVRLSNAAESAFDTSVEPTTVLNTDGSESEPDTSMLVPPSNAGLRIRSTRSELTIRSNRNETVTCKDGTVLFFPAESFVTSTGKAVTGKVRLVVDECYGLDDMVAEKLSTTSGDKRLETAGMIRVKAYSNNREVVLREGGRYNIHFPVKGEFKDDFKLFYGSRNSQGIMDWRLEEAATPVDESTPVSSTIINDCFIQISASQFRCGTRIQEMDYFNWPLSNGQNLNQWFVSNFNPDPEMLDDFCAGRMYSQLTFHLNEDGTFRDYYVSHSSREDYDRVLAEVLSSMPPMAMNQFMPVYNNDHACILSFGRQQGRNAGKFLDRFVKRYDYADADKKLTGVKTEDLEYYVFSSTELGWINCDRFLNNEAPLCDVFVDAKGYTGASVSMVFDSDRSIVAGTKNGSVFEFRRVPANRKVRLLALDNTGGNPRMRVESINTSCEKHSLRSPEPITLADLDRALCWN
jgi:hypothetical protein